MADHLLALPSGFELHEYQLLRLLGSGGFGITYLAYDTNLSKPVAIKEYLPIDLAVRQDGTTVVPKSEADQPSYAWGLERFLDEARTLARFKHPNIIQVHRYFQAHGTGYIVMEFAEGETLAAHIKRNGPMTEAAVKAILLPILDGLVEVHGNNFLHRDIKPGNIIIRKNGTPVLLDFSAARQAVGAKSRSVTAIVTPGYAPIEQYSSKGRQGPWTDIYALGAVAYCCISGNPPPDAADRILEDTLSPLSQQRISGYSRPFLEAIDVALAVREKDRPADIGSWRTRLTSPVAASPQLEETVAVAGTVAVPAGDATMLATRHARTEVHDVPLRHEPRERIAAAPERMAAGRRRWPWLVVVTLLAGSAGGGYWWVRAHGNPLASMLAGGAADSGGSTDPRQRAIGLEVEVANLLEASHASVPSLQHELDGARAELARVAQQLTAATTGSAERATLEAEQQRLQGRMQRLEDEIRLLQLWVWRSEELAHVTDRLADARATMQSLDYAGAAGVLGAAKGAIGRMDQARRQLGAALDARESFLRLRFGVEATLASEALGTLDAAATVAVAEREGAQSLERGEFEAAQQRFTQADGHVREAALALVDRTVDRLKASAEAAIDRRDAPTARTAVDRAKQLLALRQRFQ
ncbi:MAG: protein kinase [Gammaproteobacteria bacterium]|nr:protein kinase [Gammaproteobacteria bacterium]